MIKLSEGSFNALKVSCLFSKDLSSNAFMSTTRVPSPVMSMYNGCLYYVILY